MVLKSPKPNDRSSKGWKSPWDELQEEKEALPIKASEKMLWVEDFLDHFPSLRRFITLQRKEVLQYPSTSSCHKIASSSRYHKYSFYSATQVITSTTISSSHPKESSTEIGNNHTKPYSTKTNSVFNLNMVNTNFLYINKHD